MNEPLDHSEQIRKQLRDATSQLQFGQDFGFDVTWAVVQSPAGPQVAWTLLMTLRNPLLAQPRLGQIAQILCNSAPTGDQIADAAAQLAEGLRAQAEAIKRPPRPRPPLALANGRQHP